MNVATRLTILAACLALCAGAIIMGNPSNNNLATVKDNVRSLGGFDWVGGYQYAAGAPQKPDVKQLETVILLYDPVKSGFQRVEFGSVQIQNDTALVQVFYFSRDGRILPFLYKLVSEKNAWKILSVERMWSVPRSHLLRGLRA
jgi:hypothetical protein